MKTVKLTVAPREEVGTRRVQRLRNSGRIPAVLYGESGVRNLSVDRKEFIELRREIGDRAALVQIEQEGSEEEATWSLIQDTQRDAISGEYRHIDLHEVVRGKPMNAAIVVHTRGVAIGVRNEGGYVEVQTHELNVRCRPRDLPEEIIVDVTELHAGDSIHVRDLTPPENVEFTDDPDLTVVTCAMAGGGRAGADATEGEEASAEPAAAE